MTVRICPARLQAAREALDAGTIRVRIVEPAPPASLASTGTGLLPGSSGRSRRISPEDDAQILAAYEAGASYEELGERFKISRTTVQNSMRRAQAAKG